MDFKEFFGGKALGVELFQRLVIVVEDECAYRLFGHAKGVRVTEVTRFGA